MVTKKGCVRTQLPPVEESWMKASETSKGKVLSEIVIIVYSGAPNANIVQNHLNIALLNVF